jgi:hypothetical protein
MALRKEKNNRVISGFFESAKRIVDRVLKEVFRVAAVMDHPFFVGS